MGHSLKVLKMHNYLSIKLISQLFKMCEHMRDMCFHLPFRK